MSQSPLDAPSPALNPDWDMLDEKPEFRALLVRKRQFIVPSLVFFMLFYLALPILVGYWPDLMKTKVWGEVNIAYVFALSQFLMAWIMAYLYVRVAAKWDKSAAAIIHGHDSQKTHPKLKSMIHQFVLGRCVHCTIPQEDVEHVGWECSDHSISAAATITDTPSPQTTDIFAILAFATGMLGFWILPIVFTPICYVCAIISYFRLKENPNLKGNGLRLTGAILGALSLLYMFYQFGIIG